jgi:hypothetical protein
MKTRRKGQGKDLYLNQYGIKAYNKGLQHKQAENIMRFELKITTMEKLSKKPLFLSDIATNTFGNQIARRCLFKNYVY